MDVSSLRSTLIIPNKPFHSLNPLSKKWQSQRPPQYVSCRTRSMLADEVEETSTTSGNGAENFYTMLSLNPQSATMNEIKRAYRSMALRCHPDVCRDPSRKEKWTKMFVQLHAAYETLSDPVLREEYDYELGLVTSKRSNRSVSVGGERWRRRWEEQVVELKRRSNRRMAQKDGSSWGSRLRVQNMENHN